MRGAVAAGNRQTAEAGAWALREGGTCVDAAIAAVFAAFVTEGPLTGPCGGGFALLHEPDRAARVLDCFFAPLTQPAALAAQLKSLSGVVDHGLFIGMTDRVYAAGPDGVRTYDRAR